jgi:DNA polymerase (family X)
MTKSEVAAALDEIGTLLEVKGENPFRAQAYHKAAAAVELVEGDLQENLDTGKLAQVRGIGQTTLETITTLLRTGEHPFLNRLRKEAPAGLIDLLKLPGLGTKKVQILYQQLGVTDLASLQQACESNRVAGLKGIGVKTQQKLLEGISFLSEAGQRVRIDEALPAATELLNRFKRLPGVLRADVCGSLRRRKETIGDIDLLISSADPGPIMDAFVNIPEVGQITGRGETKSSVVLGWRFDGRKVLLNCDLRVLADELFPFALHHCTGSAAHNKRLRARAQDRGLVLSEYGLKSERQSFTANEEADIYKALDLQYVPPELREDTGEVEAAERNGIPKLVDAKDIRGVFHNHTTYSDGAATLEEMALAAQDLGFEYLGIGDHSQSLKVARGLSPDAVRQQHREIDALNNKLDGIRILKGIECDILENGSLDFDDELLKSFDYVVVSVHTYFQMPREEMTARICKALAHPRATMLGHATGRLLLRREGYQVDIDEVLKCAARHGKMIEINAQPHRLDLDWTHCKQAKAMGIPLVINPDAHSTGELSYFWYGVNVARRGWLTKEDVINTRSLKEVMRELERRKKSQVD